MDIRKVENGEKGAMRHERSVTPFVMKSAWNNARCACCVKDGVTAQVKNEKEEECGVGPIVEEKWKEALNGECSG